MRETAVAATASSISKTPNFLFIPNFLAAFLQVSQESRKRQKGYVHTEESPILLFSQLEKNYLFVFCLFWFCLDGAVLAFFLFHLVCSVSIFPFLFPFDVTQESVLIVIHLVSFLCLLF